MTKLEFIDKINDILIGLNTAESDALGSLYDELIRDAGWNPASEVPEVGKDGDVEVIVVQDNNDVSKAIYCEIEGIRIWDLPNIKYWCYPPNED